MANEINIDSNLSSYLNAVYLEKGKIRSTIQTKFGKGLGNTFSTYGSQINSLDGNKILGKIASNALSVTYPSPEFGHKLLGNQAGTRYDYYMGSYDSYNRNCDPAYKIRQVKDFNINDYSTTTIESNNATKITVFPELKELDISSESKFLFWMFGRTTSGKVPNPLYIEFPNIEKLSIRNLNANREFKGNGFYSSGFGIFLDNVTGISLFKTNAIFLLPKLKIMGDELLNCFCNATSTMTNIAINQDLLLTQNDRNFDIISENNTYENGIPNYSNMIRYTNLKISRKE